MHFIREWPSTVFLLGFGAVYSVYYFTRVIRVRPKKYSYIGVSTCNILKNLKSVGWFDCLFAF